MLLYCVAYCILKETEWSSIIYPPFEMPLKLAKCSQSETQSEIFYDIFITTDHHQHLTFHLIQGRSQINFLKWDARELISFSRQIRVLFQLTFHFFNKTTSVATRDF